MITRSSMAIRLGIATVSSVSRAEKREPLGRSKRKPVAVLEDGGFAGGCRLERSGRRHTPRSACGGWGSGIGGVASALAVLEAEAAASLAIRS